MNKKIHQLIIYTLKKTGNNLAAFIKMPKTYEGIVYDISSAPKIPLINF